MRHGFTMVEMVLVVVIVAMLATVAVPRLASAQTGSRLTGAEKRLMSEFEAVGETAAAQGRPHTIQFHILSSELRVYLGTVVDEDARVRTVPFDQEPYGVRFVATNITSGEGVIRIDGFGMYSANAKVQIAHGGHVRVVNLDGPVAGEPITVEEAESGGGGGGGGLLSGLIGKLLGGIIHSRFPGGTR